MGALIISDRFKTLCLTITLWRYGLEKMQRFPWTCGIYTQKPREEPTIMSKDGTPNS